MIGYVEKERFYTYNNSSTYTTGSTCSNTVTLSTLTAWVSNFEVEQAEPPPYRRPKPPFIPFEPVRISRYRAPPPPRPWPVALRRFRGDLV